MVEALGKTTVTVAGTPELICKNLSAGVLASPVYAQSLLVQALPGNLGLVYIMSKKTTPGDDRVNQARVIAILAVPTSATTGPFASASFSMPNANNSFDLREIWIDGPTGEGVIATFTHSLRARLRE